MDEPRISFGEWLTRRRKSLNLTRDALAKRVPCSVSTLRRLEADDLRASLSLAEALARALNLPENQVAAFIAFARGERADLAVEHPLPSSVMPLLNLPATLTHLIGRKREIAAIGETLRKPGVRLLTLTGPPGTGKTRLSLAVAQKLARTFRDGVYFVALAPISDPKSVPAVIAQALGLKENRADLLPALTEFLGNKRLLLVLDNFEHLIPAAPLITELLSAAPEIKALVTSREILHLYGEHEFPVPPLELLDVNRLPSPQSLSFYSRCSSIQFFVERARAAKPDFRLTTENAADVARICAWLDGLPLAIEIAAAQVKWSTPSQLYGQLRDRLSALTGGPRDLTPRQQSLRGAIDWSYSLLDETEKRLFCLLGIFSGGCTEDAILAARELIFNSVEKDQTEILKTKLRGLVEKSMVQQELTPEGTARYSMLETIRDYARDQLQARGDMDRAQAWHCNYYLKFVQNINPNLAQGGEQARWLSVLEREHNNLRAALLWATADLSRAVIATELGLALYRFWLLHGHFTEGRQWMEKILSLDSALTKRRADLLRCLGDFSATQGDYERARACQEESMSISQALNDEEGVHTSMAGLATLAGRQGDYTQAASLLEQVLAYRRKMGDINQMLPTINNLAIASRRLGDLERAQKLYAESIEFARELGNHRTLAHALNGLGEVFMELKRYADASRVQRESLSIRRQMGDWKGVAFSLDGLAISLHHMSQDALATLLESACHKIFRELGIVAPLGARAENEKFLAELRAALGNSAFEKEWARGENISREEVVSLALSYSAHS